jgi:hypothetical protein
MVWVDGEALAGWRNATYTGQGGPATASTLWVSTSSKIDNYGKTFHT